MGCNGGWVTPDQGTGTAVFVGSLVGFPSGLPTQGIPSMAGVPYWVVALCAGIVCALLVSWAVLTPAIDKVVKASTGANVVRRLVGIATSIILCTIVVRIVVPQTGEWFGTLGDYFNPAFSLIALAVLAAALGIQRSDLEQTRENLLLAQKHIRDANRARRLADTSLVLLKDLHPKEKQPPHPELECGGAGPALNVKLRFYAVPDGFAISQNDPMALPSEACLVYVGGTAVLFRRRPRPISLDAPAGNEPKQQGGIFRLVVHVRWENIHATVFCYAADLRPDEHGGWRVPDRLNMARPCYVEDADATDD